MHNLNGHPVHNLGLSLLKTNIRPVSMVEPNVVADHGRHHVSEEGGLGGHEVDTPGVGDGDRREQPAVEAVQGHVEVHHQQQL